MAMPDARLLPDTPVTDMATHLARGGGRGLAAALELEPEKVIDALSESGLRGRGGAGFDTATKWRSIRTTSTADDTPVALVVNAAEGEPGTYKDRAIMLANPFQLLEGILIAAHATGARRILVGTKHHFTDVLATLRSAIDAAAREGWPGAGAIEVVPGPDDYLFGEETAMLEVIEGHLPMPRHLAPYVNGLFTESSNPSLALVNNVETLANVPLVLAEGASAWAAVGTEDSPGTMVCTVTGDVASPGVYELPLGTSLATLVVDIAGAQDVKLVCSGVSNAVITPEMLDVALGFDTMADVGTGLGSAGFMVYDQRHCIVRVMAALNEFLANESCGQCNACALGTEAITATLREVDAGEGDDTHVAALVKWATRVTDLARCGLPTGAQLLVTSMLARFADEVYDHLGTPCWSHVEEVVPKIVGLNDQTGKVTLDRP